MNIIGSRLQEPARCICDDASLAPLIMGLDYGQSAERRSATSRILTRMYRSSGHDRGMHRADSLVCQNRSPDQSDLAIPLRAERQWRFEGCSPIRDGAS